jgi:hypothetical protein
MSDRARGLGLGERLEVEAALETAFAPLRARRSTVGPTRVRAAVRWGRAEPQAPVPWAAAVSRISELGMAVGMAAFVFAAALTSVSPTGAPIPVSDGAVIDDMLEQPLAKIRPWSVRVVPLSFDDEMTRMIRWLKLDRQARPNDYIDATVPPRQPALPSPATTSQQLLARILIPLR